jgi:alkyl sulfatase BDS1-like metallo-beta-lactamase superfamily hydrolase
MPRGAFRLLLSAGVAVVACTALAAPDRTPTPTTFTLLKEHADSRIVTEEAKGKELVLGVRIIDTKEDFTIALRDQKLQVTEGLPPKAVAVLSLRRGTLLNIIEGTETLSSAVRRNLVDVQGNIDKVFEVLDCCIRGKT